jgi:hypothetical protein
LEDQVSGLEKLVCQEIVNKAFTDQTMESPQFLSLLEVLQEGDTLVVCKQAKRQMNGKDDHMKKV